MTKGKRGRPKKGESTGNSNHCTIKDPLMEPFFIVKDRYNFAVHESYVSEKGFAGKEPSGKEQERVIGYYSSFRNALNKISKEKFYTNESDFNSIQEYLDSWNEVKTGLETLLNKIKV